jgi:uncharacterized phage protein (TIGR01671 family)
MRQHEYRAWTGTKMDYDYREVSLWNGLLVAEGDTILLQWTGMLDKNGRKIYEGDVVWNTAFPKSRREKFLIEWTREEDEQLEMVGFVALDAVSGWEVIGNVYENQDLLTSKQNP